MGICVPAGAVGVDLAVGAGLVHLIPRCVVLNGDGQQAYRSDGLRSGVEEDHALAGDTGDLPRGDLALDGCFIDDGICYLYAVAGGAELLADAVVETGRLFSGQDEGAVFLLGGVGLCVILGYRRPVPFGLGTGPEGASEGVGALELREDFLVLVLEGEYLGSLAGVDCQSEVAGGDAVLGTFQ